MALVVYGPTPFVMSTADRIYQEGDSTHALDLDAQGFGLICQRLFALAKKNPTGPRPIWINGAISSTGMNNQLVRTRTALAQYQPITKFIWGPGIFDVIGSGLTIGTVNDVVNNTWLGSFNLLTQLVATYLGIPMFIVGPGFIGEKYPSGQNSVAGKDSDLDNLDAGMITIVNRVNAAYGGQGIITYLSQRQSVYAVYEPILNLPPPGIELGPLTQPDSQKCHDNPAGRFYRDQVFQQVTQLVAATAPNPTPATYALTTPPQPNSIGNRYDASVIAVANGANVTTWANSASARFGTSADLTVTPGTKPTFSTGAINGRPAVNFGGATFLRSGAFSGGSRAQPFMTAFVYKPANLAAGQILLDGLVDGGVGTQEPYVKQTITTGTIEIHSGNSQVTIAGLNPGQWHSIIVYWAGNGNTNGDGNTSVNGSSYVVIDGRVNFYMNPGTVPITGRTVGANAGGASFFNGLFTDITEWYSSLGPLPRWQDVFAWQQNMCGVLAQ